DRLSLSSGTVCRGARSLLRPVGGPAPGRGEPPGISLRADVPAADDAGGPSRLPGTRAIAAGAGDRLPGPAPLLRRPAGVEGELPPRPCRSWSLRSASG